MSGLQNLWVWRERGGVCVASGFGVSGSFTVYMSLQCKYISLSKKETRGEYVTLLKNVILQSL